MNHSSQSIEGSGNGHAARPDSEIRLSETTGPRLLPTREQIVSNAQLQRALGNTSHPSPHDDISASEHLQDARAICSSLGLLAPSPALILDVAIALAAHQTHITPWQVWNTPEDEQVLDGRENLMLRLGGKTLSGNQTIERIASRMKYHAKIE